MQTYKGQLISEMTLGALKAASSELSVIQANWQKRIDSADENHRIRKLIPLPQINPSFTKLKETIDEQIRKIENGD